MGNVHGLALTTENEVYLWGTHPTENQGVNPKKIGISKVKGIVAIRGCSVSAVETMDGKANFRGFANGHFILEPTLTKFSSTDKVFASLDSPMMLKPVQPELRQPALAERLGSNFDEVKCIITHYKFQTGNHELHILSCSKQVT